MVRDFFQELKLSEKVLFHEIGCCTLSMYLITVSVLAHPPLTIICGRLAPTFGKL
jgi:hypothetical protein